MKNLILLILFLSGLASQLFAQNPYWAFPPNYVNFNTGGTVNPLGAGSITKYGSANAIFSPGGVLQLYSTKSSSSNYNYYNRSDQLITSLPASSNDPNDVAFIPLPGEYNTYLLPSVPFSNNQYTMSLSKVSFNGTSGACISNFSSIPGYQNSNFGMAVPVTPDFNSPIGKPYLYLLGLIFNNSSYKIQLNIHYVKLGSYFTYNGIEIASGIPGFTANSTIVETEISHDGNTLAFCMKGDSYIYIIPNIQSCAGGNCNINLDNSEIIDNASAINGIEFSPDGSKLFYTKSTSPSGNQIGYLDLITKTQTDVINSAGLGNSYIEYAKDGYMYVSNGTQLRGFNINSLPYTISKTIENVQNSSLNGIYTLPDQIDGADYTLSESCKNGSVSFTTGPVVSTQATGSITASGTAEVSSGANIFFRAGTSIILQSGFRALNGSTFSAKTGPCTSNCTSTVYRKASEEVADMSYEIQIVKPFPNPITTGQLNFGSVVSNYSLINSTGVEVLKGNNTGMLDVTDLPKGMYMLKLDDKTEKIIIQ